MEEKQIDIVGIRKKLGITQEKLAQKLNIASSTVSRWERGICNPTPSVYKRILKIRGVRNGTGPLA